MGHPVILTNAPTAKPKKEKKVHTGGSKRKADYLAYRALDKAGINRRKTIERHAKRQHQHLLKLVKRAEQGKPCRGDARNLRRHGNGE